MVRNPLSRAISVYYFWGELFKVKMRESKLRRSKGIMSIFAEKGKLGRLGQVQGAGNETVEVILTGTSNHFTYHGTEATVPEHSIALKFGENLPYSFGMPGPSGV